MKDNKKGFSILEVIMSIFICGLLIIHIFPVLNINIQINNKNLLDNNENYEIINIIETIKISHRNKLDIGLYPIDILELFDSFENNTYYEEEFNIKENKVLLIKKEDMSHNFWRLKIFIYKEEEGIDHDKGVEFLLQR